MAGCCHVSLSFWEKITSGKRHVIFDSDYVYDIYIYPFILDSTCSVQPVAETETVPPSGQFAHALGHRHLHAPGASGFDVLIGHFRFAGVHPWDLAGDLLGTLTGPHLSALERQMTRRKPKCGVKSKTRLTIKQR